MRARLAILDYLHRLFQVTAVFAALALRLLYRRLRGRPTQGPLLLRQALETLSGAFVKFGQILSLQIDTLPRQYCDALLALLDSVPPFSREQVDEIFRQDFRAAPPNLYAKFDYQTVASASIGQVHKAVLKDGTTAAVKVQRPNIRPVFERDNRLLGIFVRLIFFFRIRQLYFMRDPVRELSTWTRDELDYRREAAYCQLLSDNAVHTPSERVPKIYWDLTTARVLTMDYLEGPSVAAYLRLLEEDDQARMAALRSQGFDPSKFVSNVISNFLSDAFRFGVFHADLHPANLLILPNNVVGYVDFGIVAILTPEARRKQIELTLAYSSGDPDAIYQGFLNICIVGEDADLQGLRRRIQELVAQWYHEPAVGGRVRFRVTVTRAMMDLLSVCRDYGVLVDREMIKYIRATILTDGMVSRLAPDFDLASTLRSVVEEYLAGEARRKIFSQGGLQAILTDLTLWLQAGPTALLHALDLLNRSQLRVRSGLTAPPDKHAPLRIRALAVAAIWGTAVLVLGFSGAFPSWRSAPFLATLTGVFVALWTLWLLRLLQRLVSK
jgi:ubiquinone biosynthesis protein